MLFRKTYLEKLLFRLLSLRCTGFSQFRASPNPPCLFQKMAEDASKEKDLDAQQEMDGFPESSDHPEEVQGVENDLGAVKEKKWPGWPGENVFRLLIPVQKVGVIIGRKGECIKKVCEETKARIKVLDAPPGTTERTVLISAKEEPDFPMPPALDGLLKIHKRIVDAESYPTNAPSSGTSCTKLLVAGAQAGSLIGKQGATIKSIQDDSHCTIRVLGRESLPAFALPDDSVVEIQGDPSGLQKAVESIGTQLRKYLVDRSVIGVFEMQMQMPNARANQIMAPSQSWGLTPPAFHRNVGGHGYGSNFPFMELPSQQYDNYHPPVDMLSLDTQSRLGAPTYGREMSMGAHSNNVEHQQAVIAKVTQNMQIPLAYADAVIGVNGTNISYIRRASGATVVIQESRAIPGEMTVEINGSASQVQAAQQLIQNSIADAINSAQNPAGGPPPPQTYNAYAAHGPMYPSSVTNSAGPAGYAAGDPSSIYRANYGY